MTALVTLAAVAAACATAPVVADPAPRATSSPPPASPTALPTAALLPAPAPASPTAPPPTRAAPAEVTPTAVLRPSPTAAPETTLLFTGDINPGRCVYAKAKQADDMALPYRPLAPILQAADIAIGSLDGALSDYNPPPPCVETHRNLLGPPESVEGMAFAGFDVITVATNHAKDCGLGRGCVNDSLFDTLANLRAAGIEPTGAGANLAEATTPAILTVNGVRFAFLGFSAINGQIWAADGTPGTAPLGRDVYVDAIQRARALADVVVVLPHWGREFTGTISYNQQQAAGELVAAGATLVIGNHPHRVQGVETFPNGAVAAYALGNFVFDMTWSDGTLFTIQGIMLRARFRGPQLAGLDLIPVHIDDDFQPRLAEGDEADQILADVQASLATLPRR